MDNRTMARLLARETVKWLEESKVEDFLERMKYETNRKKVKPTIIIYTTEVLDGR